MQMLNCKLPIVENPSDMNICLPNIHSLENESFSSIAEQVKFSNDVTPQPTTFRLPNPVPLEPQIQISIPNPLIFFNNPSSSFKGSDTIKLEATNGYNQFDCLLSSCLSNNRETDNIHCRNSFSSFPCTNPFSMDNSSSLPSMSSLLQISESLIQQSSGKYYEILKKGNISSNALEQQQLSKSSLLQQKQDQLSSLKKRVLEDSNEFQKKDRKAIVNETSIELHPKKEPIHPQKEEETKRLRVGESVVDRVPPSFCISKCADTITSTSGKMIQQECTSLDLYDQQWASRFAQLIEFKKIFGHCNVTRTTKTWRSLGNWVAEQRRKMKQHKLTKIQILSLLEIGFEWDRKYYFQSGSQGRLRKTPCDSPNTNNAQSEQPQ